MIDLNEYHRSVELSKMRQLMRYGEKEYRQDWELAIALAELMAVDHMTQQINGGTAGEVMLDSCFKRMSAYQANNPEALPFEVKG